MEKQEVSSTEMQRQIVELSAQLAIARSGQRTVDNPIASTSYDEFRTSHYGSENRQPTYERQRGGTLSALPEWNRAGFYAPETRQSILAKRLPIARFQSFDGDAKQLADVRKRLYQLSPQRAR